MEIDPDTQIGADGERHETGEAPTDPAPYRHNPVAAGDAATLEAAISYVNGIDRDTQWLDDRVLTGRFFEQWLRMPAGARSNGDIGDAMAVGIEAGSDGTVTRSSLYAQNSITLGASTVHAASTTAKGAARLVSPSLMGAASPAVIDYRVRFPIGGSLAQDYRVALGNGAGEFEVGPHASNPALVQVYASVFNGTGYTATPIAETTAIDFHQFRLVSLGGLTYRWIIDGEVVHEAVAVDVPVILPVRAGIWKLAGTSARTVELYRVAAVWG